MYQVYVPIYCQGRINGFFVLKTRKPMLSLSAPSPPLPREGGTTASSRREPPDRVPSPRPPLLLQKGSSSPGSPKGKASSNVRTAPIGALTSPLNLNPHLVESLEESGQVGGYAMSSFTRDKNSEGRGGSSDWFCICGESECWGPRPPVQN